MRAAPDTVKRAVRRLEDRAYRFFTAVGIQRSQGALAAEAQVAPRSGVFVGVDTSSATLEECGRQLAEVCDTPWQPVLVDVAEPG